jgi:hypothetical protein
MLLVVNWPQGPDKNHPLEPQLISPVGYCPVRGAFTFVKSSKVTILLVSVNVAVLFAPP